MSRRRNLFARRHKQLFLSYSRVVRDSIRFDPVMMVVVGEQTTSQELFRIQTFTHCTDNKDNKWIFLKRNNSHFTEFFYIFL